MKKGIILFVLAVLVVACKKDKPKPPPSAAALLFPTKDEACNAGTVISDTQSSIIFRWAGAANSDTYELNIKNLESGVSTLQSTSKTEAEVVLFRKTPYSWHVVSKSSKVPAAAQSEIWKFYNSGLGAVTYAPFPAEIVAPAFGQNVAAVAGKITLSWKGSDVDGDILSYDVYFGTNASPALFKNVSVNTLNDVIVAGNTTYYWKIITKDSKGNTSDSGMYHFRAN